MVAPRDGKENFECVFCSKSKKDGLKLIGGNGVYVCEECIRNSFALLQKISDEDEKRTTRSILKPADIKRALDEYVIDGISTTIPFHLDVMRNEAFASGNVTTKFVEEHFSNKA